MPLSTGIRLYMMTGIWSWNIGIGNAMRMDSNTGACCVQKSSGRMIPSQSPNYKETYEFQGLLRFDENTLTFCCFILKWEAVPRETMGRVSRKSKLLWTVPLHPMTVQKMNCFLTLFLQLDQVLGIHNRSWNSNVSIKKSQRECFSV